MSPFKIKDCLVVLRKRQRLDIPQDQIGNGIVSITFCLTGAGGTAVEDGIFTAATGKKGEEEGDQDSFEWGRDRSHTLLFCNPSARYLTHPHF